MSGGVAATAAGHYIDLEGQASFGKAYILF